LPTVSGSRIRLRTSGAAHFSAQQELRLLNGRIKSLRSAPLSSVEVVLLTILGGDLPDRLGALGGGNQS